MKKYFLIAIVTLLPILIASAQNYGQNLIVNPSAEQAPLSNGWYEIDGGDKDNDADWYQRGNRSSNGATLPKAMNGDYIFFLGGIQLSKAFIPFYNEDFDLSLAQDISVSSFTSISSGRQVFVFTGYMMQSTDKGQMTIQYRNNTGAVLSEYSTGLTSSDKDRWTQYKDQRLAPTGTTTIRITLRVKQVLGDDVDAYFDNLSLVAVPVSTCN